MLLLVGELAPQALHQLVHGKERWKVWATHDEVQVDFIAH